MSKFFSEDELKCPCCGECKMNPEFMEAIDALREEYGMPLLCKAPEWGSAYRCADHNAAVGGVAGSYHTVGRAIDFHAPTVKMRMKIMELAPKHGLNGVGLGANFVHLDNRTKKTFWTYR